VLNFIFKILYGPLHVTNVVFSPCNNNTHLYKLNKESTRHHTKLRSFIHSLVIAPIPMSITYSRSSKTRRIHKNTELYVLIKQIVMLA